jgi:hypothetical protein
MALTGRRTGLDVGTVTIGASNYVADITNANVTVENHTEDGRGVADRWEFAILTGSRVSFEGEAEADATAPSLMAHAAGGSALAYAFNTGVHTYSGSCVVTSVGQTFNRGEIQKFRVAFSGRGAPTIS